MEQFLMISYLFCLFVLWLNFGIEFFNKIVISALRFAAAVYNLVTDRRFELAIMVAILLNMVVMAIESHDANEQAIFVLEQLNNIFVGELKTLYGHCPGWTGT